MTTGKETKTTPNSAFITIIIVIITNNNNNSKREQATPAAITGNLQSPCS